MNNISTAKISTLPEIIKKEEINFCCSVKSLMENNQKYNQIEISRLFPKLRTVKYGRHKTSSGAFKEGFQNGKNTHINKGMGYRGKGTLGLILYNSS